MPMTKEEIEKSVAEAELVSEALWAVFNDTGKGFSTGTILLAAAKTLAAVILEIADTSDCTVEEVYDDADYTVQKVLLANCPEFEEHFAYNDLEEEGGMN